MDVLSDILGALRLEGTLYFSTEFTPPWGVKVPPFGRVARFHLVVRGQSWIRVEGLEKPILLEPGDMVVIPHGAEHSLSDDPVRPCLSVDQVVEESGFSGKGALVFGGADPALLESSCLTRLICGHFQFDGTADHVLLTSLPPALVVRWRDYVDYAPLADVFAFIVREIRDDRPGAEAIVQRLSEVLFIEAVRFWAERDRPDTGIMAAMADPRLGPSLEAIHEEPGERWTLETLARKAALGRTAFSARFREVVGMTPLQYVTFWRMQKAKDLLVQQGISMDVIAARIGYESAAAFSRVFKKVVGENPGAYRRERR